MVIYSYDDENIDNHGKAISKAASVRAASVVFKVFYELEFQAKEIEWLCLNKRRL